MQEVAGIVDHLDTRSGRELGQCLVREFRRNASVVCSVQVERGLRAAATRAPRYRSRSACCEAQCPRGSSRVPRSTGETNGACLNFCSISRAIARRLGRSPATIRREIARHGGRGRYRAAEADRRAWDNARRPQRCKLALHPALCKLVACKLSEDWSPQQIAGWQKLGSPEDHTCGVSHETIYQTLFIQTRGALKRELLLGLRRAGSVRRPQVAKGQHAGQGQIRDASRFESAPPEAEDRAVPGHWEREPA